jgi:hypothetical protein
MNSALFSDIDGVFHPSTAIRGIDLSRLGVLPRLEIQRLNLFRWCARLDDVLRRAEAAHPGTPPIMLFVHSNWRRLPWSTNSFLVDALGPLGHRFAGVTPPDMGRQQSIESLCERLDITNRLILDDASAEFGPDTPGLVITDPLLGVSAPAVMAKVEAWALERGAAAAIRPQRATARP